MVFDSKVEIRRLNKRENEMKRKTPTSIFFSKLKIESHERTTLLGKISSWLIYLIFNYQPGLVGLELTQNICEGREVPRMSW